ncbi:MAG: hypothetical protein HY724_04265 [Candidatus Rokubacteria bacterium]|nr:hypothetical protein [Candidatus Rokubacteria bacterium]
MLEPADKYMVLLTTFSVQLDGVWAFYASTCTQIDRLAKHPWEDENLTHSENKFRMKALGGLLFSCRRFAKELSILALAKALEDLSFEAEQLGCPKFNVWKGDELGLRYHRDMRYIRVLANVIKHSGSRVVDNGEKNNRFLIDKCGVTPGSEVEYLNIDIPRYVYRIHWFLDQLAAHLTGVEPPQVPKHERRGFTRFRRTILPSFVKL